MGFKKKKKHTSLVLVLYWNNYSTTADTGLTWCHLNKENGVFSIEPLLGFCLYSQTQSILPTAKAD